MQNELNRAYIGSTFCIYTNSLWSEPHNVWQEWINAGNLKSSTLTFYSPQDNHNQHTKNSLCLSALLGLFIDM